MIHTVVPEKVTAAPVLSLDRSIELEAGAEIPDKIMFEHDATAAEIEAQAVTVQAVPPPPAGADVAVVVTLVAVVLVFNVVGYNNHLRLAKWNPLRGTYTYSGGCWCCRRREACAHAGDLARLVGASARPRWQRRRSRVDRCGVRSAKSLSQHTYGRGARISVGIGTTKNQREKSYSDEKLHIEYRAKTSNNTDFQDITNERQTEVGLPYTLYTNVYG